MLDNATEKADIEHGDGLTRLDKVASERLYPFAAGGCQRPQSELCTPPLPHMTNSQARCLRDAAEISAPFWEVRTSPDAPSPR